MPKRKQRLDASKKKGAAALRREARKRAAARRKATEQREKRKLAAKKFSISRLPIVRAADVRLGRGNGTKIRGGGPGGSYWHILVSEERVGHIYINVIDEQPLGVHPSIQIFLNKEQRGRQIGRVAYRLACEASSHDEVFAHMRKSNLASKRAAEEAGFSVVENDNIPQLAMVWRRKSHDERSPVISVSS